MGGARQQLVARRLAAAMIEHLVDPGEDLVWSGDVEGLHAGVAGDDDPAHVAIVVDRNDGVNDIDPTFPAKGCHFQRALVRWAASNV